MPDYLHDWTHYWELDGEGFAPLSQPTHHCITAAALETLPTAAAAFYSPARELLTWTYCGFPDMNWHWYGTWAEDSGGPQGVRWPDTRSEWELPRLCEYDSALKQGQWYGHMPPDTITAACAFWTRAVERLQQRGTDHAMRTLGIALHYAQDTGSPSHACNEPPPLHSMMERLSETAVRSIRVSEPPRPITDAEQLARRLEALWAAASERAPAIREKCAAGKHGEAEPDILACALDSARTTADILAGFAELAPKFVWQHNPALYDLNLISPPHEGSMDGDRKLPGGWTRCWLDRTLRGGELSWEQDLFRIADAAEPGQGWMRSWPACVRVEPGETFEARTLVSKSTGDKAALEIQAFDAATRLIETAVCENRATPEVELGVTMEVPASARWMRVRMRGVCPGSVITFRLPSLVRVPTGSRR